MIRLWERDYNIMLGLARNGFMRVDQIEKRWFPSYWSAIKRLEKLREDGYLLVTYMERYGKGIYYLSKQGLEFINSHFGEEYKSYGRSNKISHFLSCAEFYINIPKDMEVIEYELEYYLGNFIPDIYIQVKIDTDDGEDIIRNCLVEIDNLGKIKRFIPKIKNYNEYMITDEYKKQFGKFPRCVVVTDSKGLQDKINEMSKIPFRLINFEQLKNGKLTEILK